MTHCHNLEAVDRILRDLPRSRLPLGGIIMLHLGDFRQILAVVLAYNSSQIVSACFKRSGLNPLLKCFHLQENMRLQVFRQNPYATSDAL